jgi:hypothetical protein
MLNGSDSFSDRVREVLFHHDIETCPGTSQWGLFFLEDKQPELEAADRLMPMTGALPPVARMYTFMAWCLDTATLPLLQYVASGSVSEYGPGYDQHIHDSGSFLKS